MVTGGRGGREPEKTDEHDTSADASLQGDATEEPLQDPIRVKRTPRLRSGKHEEPDSSD
jgi:hypothetical protein